MRDTAHRAVAVVGLSAILPDAPDARRFWDNLKSGRYSISDVDAERWDPALYYDPDPKAPDMTYSRIGGWVRDWEWDPFGWRLPIPPKVADAMDDTQRWGINCARAALADYGYPERKLDPDRTAVILGNAMAGEKHYLSAMRISFPEFARELEHASSFAELPESTRRAIIAEARHRFRDLIPNITEDTMPGELANCIAGRLANLFNFHGPNFVVDAACASAMAAFSAAIEGLEEHDFDAVLTGGIDCNMSASTYVKFCKIGALSATGTRPYAAGADGFVMGEGAALFLLKRLEDAERDNDRIYAVLRGLAGSSDGKGKGITAPNPVGQKLCIQRAWENAGLSPATATLLEGHGTSTRVGDVVEVESLSEVFSNAGASPGSVALGSVKSNIGHLKGAAGAAGLLKTVLALHEKVLPPSLNFEEPNPNIDFSHSPFRVNTELRDWDNPGDGVRRAGVSAFGFGGTNFHAVLEEHIPGRLAVGSRHRGRRVGTAAPGESVQAAATKPPLRGAAVIGASSAAELAGRLRALKADAEASRIPDRQAPLASDLEAAERIAIDFADPPELARKAEQTLKALDRDHPGMWSALAAQGVFRGQGDRKKIAFLYPGQGSQYVNMLKDLVEVEPIARGTLEQADRVMTPLLGKPLSDCLFAAGDDAAQIAAAEQALKQTEVTQPAVLTIDLTLSRLFAAYGIEPDMVMGHSLGEYGALAAAGALGFAEALEAVSARGKEMSRVSVEDNGKMAAVFAPLDEVQRILAAIDGYAVIANINSTGQAVIGGATVAIEQAVQACTAAGFQAIELPVSHAFHTRIVAPASGPLCEVLARLNLRSPVVPVVTNVTGNFYPQGDGVADQIIDLLGRQIASPVQFVKGLDTLYSAGARVFVEVGPKKALKGFVDDVLGSRGDVVSLHSNHPKAGELASFNQALCGLYAAGHGTGRSKPVSAELGAPSRQGDGEAAPRPAATTARSEVPAAAPQPAPTPATTSPVAAMPAVPGQDPYQALGGLFAEFMQRGMQLLQGGPVDRAPGRVVITGASVGLPGRPRVFADDNFSAILHGAQLIDVFPYRFRQAIVDKRITRLVKSADGDPHFETINRTQDVVKLAGRAGAFDLAEEFGVNPDRVAAFDSTTALAVGIGLDALRNAGIPLVLQYKTTTTGSKLPDRWRLPDELRDSTGIIFATAFPGADAFAEDLVRYHKARGLQEQLDELISLREWLGHQGNGNTAVRDELDRRIAEQESVVRKNEFRFDRRFLFRALPMGHSQFAEEIGARGPNTQINGACASTTQAVALAEDWVRRGRCERVIIISADNVTSDNLLEWVGGGFLASGAAATDEAVEEAATPFDRRRHGMIVGMGAAGLVVESDASAQARGIRPIAEVLGSVAANSAFHGTRLDIQHISQVMEQLIADVERRHGLRREDLAPQTVFVSHETYTPARGGSASAEVHALRNVFGDKADEIVITNTKGFTGHAMGAGVEDVIGIKALETGIVPPVPNFKEIDPELGSLNLSTGGSYPVQYALRLGAGFGSQIGMSLIRWVPTQDGQRRHPDEIGFEYRIADPEAWTAWLSRASGYANAECEVASRRLRIKDQGPPAETGTVASRPAAARPALAARPGATAVAQATPAAAPAPSGGIAPATAVATPVPAETAGPPPGDKGVADRVLALVAEQTGYPADMLEMDLDLEADLGIDTVKQAEMFAAIREAYDIPRDDNLQLRDFPTLAHTVQFVVDRAPGLATDAAAGPAVEATPDEPAAAAPQAAVADELLALVAEQTGYPADMLEMDLDLEADLGIDTVKQAEMFAAIREAYDIPRDPNLQLRDFPTLAHTVQFVLDRAPGLKSAGPAPETETPAVEVVSTVTLSGSPAAGEDSALPERVVAIVAEKTGYPADMLEMDLDLEADLGIDTVKQAEIFAALREAHGIPRDPNLQLKDFPTLNHAVEFVRQRAPGDPADAEADKPPIPATPEVHVEVPAGDPAASAAVPRRIPVPVWRPPPGLCKHSGVELGEDTRVLIMPDRGGVAKALDKRLGKRGVTTLLLDPGLDAAALEAQLATWLADGPVQGIYWLPALDQEAPLTEMSFEDWQHALGRRVKLLRTAMQSLYEAFETPGTFLVAATRLGGRHGYDADGALDPLGGAVTGFVKALAREREAALCKTVDFPPSRKTAALADILIEETLRDPGVVEIGVCDGERWCVGLEERALEDGVGGTPLGPESVYVVTGAAGSIVSAIVADLAAASAGTFHLLDLTPEPDRQDADLERFETDHEGLKRDIFERLKAGGDRVTPVMVERELARLERAHAALAAIEAVEAAGGTARYHSVDLTDHAAMARVMEDIASRHERVDVLMHAAGLEISHFLPDKAPEEFDLVFDVKANGWFNLVRGLGETPIANAVVFSSVAGRFGNGGQTDYSAANDLLCKSVSALRHQRPGTRGLAIDWTAWDRIGMASRGSIPTMMAVAGIDMLAPEAGIPVVRRELTLDSSAAEVLVAAGLGMLMAERDPSGGLATEHIDTSHCGPMIGEVLGMSVAEGLTVQTVLDPAEQPFLADHQIEGTAVLPGVMGMEAFAELSLLLLPGWQVLEVGDVRFLSAFKFYRGEPRKLILGARFVASGDELLAKCRLTGVRRLKHQAEPQFTTHFTATVRLGRELPAPLQLEQPAQPTNGSVERDQVYRAYFHGPAYQVLSSAWQEKPGTMVGAMTRELPANHLPADKPLLLAPRHIELCFQTAGMYELAIEDRFGLPAQIGRLIKYRDPREEAAPIFTLVRHHGDGPGFDADVVDEAGNVYLRMEDYRTAALPGGPAEQIVEPIRSALCDDR